MGFMLEKTATGSTPYIQIDEERGYMIFKGESFHENVVEFYKETGDWLKRYMAGDFSRFTFDCELRYFNSSTAKLILNILMELDARAAEGRRVTVNWITSEDNDIIRECGEDFLEEVHHLEFNFVVV